jgi:6-phosphogluconolactonase
MTPAPEIHVFRDPQELAERAADLFLESGNRAIATSNRFLVALSGGSTPELLYTRLASTDRARLLDWSKAQFLFGDERAVPPSHPDSNFAMADKALFRPLNIPAAQIHRMRGEAPPEAAATEYENRLRQLCNPAPGEWPVLDLVLLGLGTDGHTASLFPGTPSLDETTRWVVPSLAPEGTRSRLTLTLGVINHAAVVLFLVAGWAKSQIIQRIHERQPTDAAHYPASRVRPQSGRLLWYLDRAAASNLSLSDPKTSS